MSQQRSKPFVAQGGRLAQLAPLVFLTAIMCSVSASASHPVNPMLVCVANLRQIEAAKEQWMLERKIPANHLPTQEEEREIYGLVRGGKPACLQGGTYVIGAAGAPPKCSAHGTREEADALAIRWANQQSRRESLLGMLSLVGISGGVIGLMLLVSRSGLATSVRQPLSALLPGVYFLMCLFLMSVRGGIWLAGLVGVLFLGLGAWVALKNRKKTKP